jgi:hypothetical protein
MIENGVAEGDVGFGVAERGIAEECRAAAGLRSAVL